MKKITLVFALFLSSLLAGQTKLDLLSKQLLKSAEIELGKLSLKENMELNNDRNLNHTVIPPYYSSKFSDYKLVINDASPIENIYHVNGQVSYMASLFSDDKLLQTIPVTREFTAKAKEVLEDFVISEFFIKEIKQK